MGVAENRVRYARKNISLSMAVAIRDFSVSTCLSHPRIKLLSQIVHLCYMSRLVKETTKWHVRPVWWESSLSAWRKLRSLASSYPLNAQRLWSDWADAKSDLSLGWAHSHFLGVLSWRRSYIDAQELLLQHMFLDCNCIYKHFVLQYKNLNRIRSSEMNMIFSK